MVSFCLLINSKFELSEVNLSGYSFYCKAIFSNKEHGNDVVSKKFGSNHYSRSSKFNIKNCILMDKIKMSQNGEFLLDYDNLYCLVMD
jgi:hypothetical protein